MNQQYQYQQQPYQPFQAPYQNQGMVMNQPQKKVFFTNPLGPDKIKELLSKGNQSKAIAITEQDINQAVCTHRYDNTSYLVQLPDGRWRCRICGEEFNLVQDATAEEIELATRNLLDIWNSAKFSNIDMPEKTCTEFYAALAYVKKTPDMYKLAIDNINNYYGPQVAGAYSPNPWDQFNTIMAQPMAGGMGYGQPVYGMPQQYAPVAPQGFVQQQPVYAQPYDAQAQAMQMNAPGSNGFGYNAAPQPTVQQVPQGFVQQQPAGYMPQQQAYVPQPVQQPGPSANNGVTVTKSVTE